jgi:hypothetical protein
MRVGPIQQLVSTGTSPLVAYGYVTVAVTVASPLLIVSRLPSVEAADLPLLATVATNAALLWMLVVAVVREIRLRVRQMLLG